MPYPTDLSQDQGYRYDLGSNWTQKLYTCASSVKASIKTVTFTTNGTEALDGLVVQDVQDKDYQNETLPLWGIEKADEYTYKIEDINLFWGLVNETYVNSSRVQIQSATEIYLPTANHDVTFGHIPDSFAAGTAFTAAWNSAYMYSAAISGTAIDFIPRHVLSSLLPCTKMVNVSILETAPAERVTTP
jgi:hypothetical protein